MLKHVASVAVLLAGFFLLLKGNVIYGPFIYDESDYMYAASRGFTGNWMDSPSLSLPQFVHMGLSARADPSRRTELAENIRGANDLVFYRHWHGPLYLDWLLAVKGFASSEQMLRSFNVVFPIATALLMYFGAVWILGGAAGQLAAIFSAALYLWSYPAIRANELAPHQLFALCVTACLIYLARMMQTGERRDWYAAVVASALAFCTLEIAFALIATVLICGHLVRDRLHLDVPFALKSLGAFIGTVLIVWLGAVLKLSFVKAYAFMAYLALFQKNAWGANISVAGAWWMRFVLSPVPWALVAIAAVLLISRRLAWTPVLTPFAVFFVAMFLAIFKVNADAPRYALPIMPGVVLLGAWTVALWLVKFPNSVRMGGVAVVLVAMALTTLRGIGIYPLREDPKSYALLDLIRQDHLEDKKLLVPHDDLPIVHYYFPQTRLTPYRDPSTVAAQLATGAYDGALYEPPRYLPRRAVH